ncbi:hypothetical protein F0562_005234 [Nyssa sinensis]|uniref:RING-type E3 ubiquitin transferase BRCA1 n=1 Tax=Nyssa sinensis TaxID=561372 RepID=A0A5J5AHI1_9ASTE|nr:hypothetical protein F0562_005234 [Nyssa sinensis]
MEDDLLQPQPSFRRNVSDESVHFPIQGMESVVATVSGYRGSERFKLIKLISQTGANYVGAMSRSTTHLVCWKFEGRKYELAKQFDILIVNHRWVEDCIKQGRRVPEHPYILHSGQEVGSLLLEVPHASNKANILLFDQSNVQNDYSKELVIDIECEGNENVVWADSCLLNEKLFPELGISNNRSHKLKRKDAKKSLRQDHCSSSRYFQEPPLSALVRVEYEESNSPSSVQLSRQKRSSTTSTEPSRKGRRLVKKKISRDILESCSDPEQECYPIHDPHQCNDITAPSNRSDGGRNGTKLNIRRASKKDLFDNGGSRNEGLEDGEEIKDFDDVFAPKGLNFCSEDTPTSLERTPQDQHLDVNENLNEARHVSRLPPSTELSCVICWTDFSSTRGVLPCGHRFCFSCIQSWADHMASRGKISTCPLCKASFVSITKVDDAVSSDQKIYSQTIPYDPSTTDIFILPDGDAHAFGVQSLLAPVCCECCCQEPEDLLVRCHLCQIRCVHSYCLDPPLFPWTCIHCKDLQLLYHHIHMEGASEVVIASLNILSLLWSIFVVIGSSYLILHHHSECTRESLVGELVYGIFLFPLSLVGMIGAIRKKSLLLLIYKWALLIWIIGLLCMTTFCFMASKNIAAKMSKNHQEYQLNEYPYWLQIYIADGKRWNTVKACMVEGHLCQKLSNHTDPAAKEYVVKLSTIQYGCCQPPPHCGFLNKNDTIWEVAKSGLAFNDTDCTSWGNQQDKMCYDCTSCKAGHILSLKKEITGKAFSNIEQIIILTIIYAAVRKDQQQQNDYHLPAV